MSVKEEKISEIEYTYKVSISKEDLEKKREEKFQYIAENISLPGFRKGKVPSRIIKQKYSEDVKNEIAEDFIKDTVNEAVEKHKKSPSVRPEVVDIVNEEGKLEFAFTLEFLPKMPKLSFSELSLEDYKIALTDAEYNKEVKTMLSEYKQYTDKDDKGVVEASDEIVCKIKVTVEGKVVADSNEMRISMQNHFFDKDFDKNILGKKVSDEVLKFSSKMGKDVAEEVKGKPCEVELVIGKIREQIDLTKEELMKTYSVENEEGLKQVMNDKVNQDVEQENKLYLKSRLFDFIDSSINVDLPKTLFKRELEALENNLKAEEKKSSGKDKAKKEEKIDKEALVKRRLKIGFYISEYAEDNKITVSDNEIMSHLSNGNREYEKQLRQLFKDKRELFGEVYGLLIEDKVVQNILSKVKLEEKVVSLTAFTKNSKAYYENK